MKSALLLFALAAPAAAFQPADRTALKAAVNGCCDGGLDGTFNNDCEVSGTHIKDWDTSLVTDMNSLFKGQSDTCFASMNANITKWDTSQVTRMDFMFYHAYAFNQPLEWQTGSVQYFNNMFVSAYSFNQPLNWNVEMGTNFKNMFSSAYNFNQPLNWNTASARTADAKFDNMFSLAVSFNQPLNWVFGDASTIGMFQHAASMLYSVDGVSPSGDIGQGTCGERRASPLNGMINAQRSTYITNVRSVAVTCDAGYVQKANTGGDSCVDENCDDNSLACCESACDTLLETDCKAASACWWLPGTGTCSDACDEAIHPIRDAANKICGGFVDPSQCISSCELDGISDTILKDEIVKPERSAAYQMAGLCN